MFVEVPIIGTGTMRDPFRPKLPAGTEYSAYIPTGKDGQPVLTNCLACIADNRPVPSDGRLFAKEDAVLSIKERDATKRDDPGEVGEDSDHVGRSTPATREGEGNDRVLHEDQENRDKVDTSYDTSVTIDLSYHPAHVAGEEEDQFSNSDGFRENDRDSHVDDEVPRLVRGEELHVVSHVHNH